MLPAKPTAQPQRSALNVRLVGIGAAAPDTRVTNQQLESVVETSDEWIKQRTGIGCRHLLQPGEGLTGLASTAVTRALDQAGVAAEDVELLICATSTPDDLFGDAAGVARAAGATKAVAFDLTAACSGFLFGVNTASQFLHNGAYKTAVVVGADAMSRWVNWEDRNTCVLFGDGAGAAVIKAAEAGEQPGLLGYEMHSNGKGRTHAPHAHRHTPIARPHRTHRTSLPRCLLYRSRPRAATPATLAGSLTRVHVYQATTSTSSTTARRACSVSPTRSPR